MKEKKEPLESQMVKQDIGADIRNKLTSFKNLIAMMEAGNPKLNGLIQKEMSQCKENIEYLSSVCDKEEQVQCECGNFAPVKYSVCDEDGIWNCPNCIYEMMREKTSVKEGETVFMKVVCETCKGTGNYELDTCPKCDGQEFYYKQSHMVKPETPTTKVNFLRDVPCPNCKEMSKNCGCMRNKCIQCGKPVGNITFTYCDDCWDENGKDDQ